MAQTFAAELIYKKTKKSWKMQDCQCGGVQVGCF